MDSPAAKGALKSFLRKELHDSEILYDVLIFLVAAVVVVPAFRRLRTSPVLGYGNGCAHRHLRLDHR